MEADSVGVLRALGAIAARHEVRVALEFLGFADCSVNTLEACGRVVERVNRPNVGSSSTPSTSTRATPPSRA